jgi:hypothetical protein
MVASELVPIFLRCFSCIWFLLIIITTSSTGVGTIMDMLARVDTYLEGSTNKFLIELEFNQDVLGTQPRTEQLMRQFIEAKLNREAKEADKKGIEPPTEERRQELIQRHMDRMFGASSVDKTIDDEVNRMHTTFFRDELGPYIGMYQLKACVRDMMTTLGITVSKRGSGNTRQHLFWLRACDEDGNIFEGEESLKLHFFRDGGFLEDVDGFVDKTAHVMTAQGPRSVLKRHDKMDKARLRFAILLPADIPKCRSTALLRDEEIVKIFAQAQNNGLGCSRSQGHGTFTLTRLEKLTDIPWVSKK